MAITSCYISEHRKDIRGLDLSASLLATWKSIADIAAELPHLERLALK